MVEANTVEDKSDEVDVGNVDNKNRKSNLFYGVEDTPPFFLCLAIAIQVKYCLYLLLSHKLNFIDKLCNSKTI